VSQVGVYTFTWTETNGVCTSSDNAVVTFYNQTVAEAGTGGDACDLDFVLSAVPTFGTGTWSQTAGPGFASFTPNANTATATATVSQYGTYTFTWTEGDGVCVTTDQVTVNYYEQPIANAGLGGNSCTGQYTFSAVASSGVGTWTQVSGPGTTTYSDVNSATATATASQEGTYTYQWEEVEGSCSDNATVTVNYYNQPVADAGNGGDECDLTFVFNATPSSGTGAWTQTSGPGTTSYSDATSATATATASQYGTYTYRWTEQNGTCSDFAEITVNFYDQPVANAGTGGDECDLNFVFSAIPSVGTGVWTQTSGPGTSTYNNSSSAVATVTVSQYGTYTYTWTETNGTCSDNAVVTVNYYEQPVAEAGNGGSECDLTFDLSATPSFGTGVWTASGPGTATYGSASSAATTATVSQVGVYTFTWTETNGVCTSSDNAVVTFYNQTVAEAGTGGDACDLDFVLSAVPTFGTGTWSQTAGPGFSNFVPNANDPAATAQVSVYGTYQFTWTEVNGVCTSSDAVTVNYYEQPIANAGPTADECDLNHTMAAVPSSGVGTWTQISGPGTSSYNNANSATATVTVSQYGTYVYQWEEVEGTCSDNATVTINYYDQPVANAGFGGFECDLDFQLSATPSVGTGTWTSTGPGAATFSPNTNNPNALVSVTALGAYTFTWTEQNGSCLDSDEVIVTFEQQTTANAGQGGNECDLTFTLNAQPSFGTGVWTSTGPGTAFYTDATSATASVTVSVYGTYDFTWTETNGTCVTSDQVTVNFYEQPVANAGQGGNECDLDFVFNGTASVGVGTWTQISGSGTSTFSNANSPTSSVTVSQYDTYVYQWEEIEGTCSDNATVTVNYYNQPVADAGTGGDECDLTFVFNATPSSGTGAWTQTSGPGTTSYSDATSATATATASQYGTYTYRWTEQNGTCSDFAEITVNYYDQPVANAGTGGDECDLNFVFSAIPSVGTGVWTQTSGPGTSTYNNSSSAVATVTVSQYGTYTYTWTETNGTCSDNAVVTVNYYEQPVAEAGNGGSECDLTFDLSATPSFGTGVWTASGPGTATYGSASSAATTATVSQVGVYTFTWTETNGVCTSSDNAVVTFYNQTVAEAGTGGDACDLDFVLSAVPTFGTGTWSQTAGPGFASFTPNANTATATATVSQYGTYTFTWTEGDGVCVTTDNVTVNYYEQPVANAGVAANQCDLDVAIAAIPSIGGGNWTVSGPGNSVFIPSTNVPSAVANVDNYGTYQFTWTEDNNGCVDTDVISIVFNQLPLVNYTGLGASYCVDPAVLIPLTGSPVGGTFSGQGVANSNFIPFAAGVGTFDVTYTYTDANGCTNSQVQSTSVSGVPSVSFSGLGTSYCEDDASVIALSGSPAGGTFAGAGISGESFIPNTAGLGSHVISYTFGDVNGCSSTSTQSVLINLLPAVSFSGLAPSYCGVSSVVPLVGSPAGGVFSGPGISGNNFNPIAAGSGEHVITYTFTSGNGCSNSTTQTVAVNALIQPVISANGPLVFCEGSSVTLDAGSGYNQYIWSNNQVGQLITVSEAGIYRVTVSDDQGCEATSATVQVVVNSAPVVDLGPDLTICSGSFGTLDAGNAGSAFEWSTQEITQQIIVGTAGVYDVVVTGANGCSSTDAITVAEGTVLNPVITANGSTTFCEGQSLTLNGGAGYDSYLWANGGVASQLLTITTGGTYNLTVTDAFGCTGTASILTVSNPLPNAVIVPNGSTNLCSAGSSVTLNAVNTSGNYLWSITGEITSTIEASIAGSYTVTVTDPTTGCAATSLPVVVTQGTSAAPVIVASGPTEFCDGGSVVLSVEPSDEYISYLWVTGSFDPTITVEESGSYWVQVVDANNCINNTLVNNPTVVTVWDPTPIIVQNGGDLQVSNGPFATYQWFRNGNPVPGENGPTFTPSTSGNYYVQVTDVNGCTANSSNIEFTATGTGDENDLFSLNIYPNPNNGQFTIEADLGTSTDVTLVVKDVLGRELMQPERIETTTTFRRSFDISHLSNGVYYVHIIGSEGFTVKSVVKN
jgi:hypothetical protein